MSRPPAFYFCLLFLVRWNPRYLIVARFVPSKMSLMCRRLRPKFGTRSKPYLPFEKANCSHPGVIVLDFLIPSRRRCRMKALEEYAERHLTEAFCLLKPSIFGSRNIGCHFPFIQKQHGFPVHLWMSMSPWVGLTSMCCAENTESSRRGMGTSVYIRRVGSVSQRISIGTHICGQTHLCRIYREQFCMWCSRGQKRRLEIRTRSLSLLEQPKSSSQFRPSSLWTQSYVLP